MNTETPEMFIIQNHHVKSREVTPEDIERVKTDAKIMHELLFKPEYQVKPERIKLGLAIVHSQITDIDPLRFFVMRDGTVIINPRIDKHTRTTVDSSEGCLTFPDKQDIIVQRWNKCMVSFQIIYQDKLLVHTAQNVESVGAKIFQHEIEHMDGVNIYGE